MIPSLQVGVYVNIKERDSKRVICVEFHFKSLYEIFSQTDNESQSSGPKNANCYAWQLAETADY